MTLAIGGVPASKPRGAGRKLALYNDSDDLERFFEALDQALDMLR